MFTGYAGYYICRSNLSIVAPALVREFADRGVDRAGLGLIVSAGILAYAVGKVVTGIIGDFLGGRAAFIGGMLLSTIATVAFGLSSALPLFLAIWVVNRFVQSVGWGAVVKVAAHWFEPATYGTVMAGLSLSFLFGDAVGRFALGRLMEEGLGWRGIFLVAAGVLGLIAVVCAVVLRDAPASIGLPPPSVSRINLFGKEGSISTPQSVRSLLEPFLSSPSFVAICVVSFGLTMIRETFNAWTPTYLVDVYGLTHSEAAQTSSIFPFIGGVSVLVVGRLSDTVPAEKRLVLTIPLLGLAVIALMSIGTPMVMANRTAGRVLLAAVAFLLIGPYSLLGGAMAADLGGRRAGSTAAGLIDGAGYLGAVASGWGVGTLAERAGWAVAFRALAAVSAGALAAVVMYCAVQARTTVVPPVAATEEPG